MNKDKIIDYIYGELSPTEQIEFENLMEQDELLRKEVDHLLESRNLISEGKEYLPPKESYEQKFPYTKKVKKFSKWWAVAASLLMIAAVGYFSGLHVGMKDRSVIIGFGESKFDHDPKNQENYLTKDEFYLAFSELKKSLNLINNEVPEVPDGKKDIGNMIDTAMRSLDKKYRNWTQETYVAYQEDTRIQTESIIKEFLDYYEIKRAEDISQINEGLTNLALMVQESSAGLPQYAYQPAQ